MFVPDRFKYGSVLCYVFVSVSIVQVLQCIMSSILNIVIGSKLMLVLSAMRCCVLLQ